jgi:bacterioferritin
MPASKLQAILASELIAAQQFQAHSVIFAAEGYRQLSETLQRRSAEASQHAAALAGLGVHAELDEPRIGRGVKSMLEIDLALEQDLVPQLTAAIRASTAATRQLLEAILVTEERHLDWLEAQLHLIAELGVEDYCASQQTA